MKKRVLLIGGGGTLGTHVGEELLRMGCCVDVICPEEKTSDDPDLRFFRAKGTPEYLQELFGETHYDGTVNFIHYPEVKEYMAVHDLLAAGTEHLIFLSSYRIYADEQHPITESAPQLLETSRDEAFLQHERYALPKAQAENFLREKHAGEHWTAVRPVISFSRYRFDIVNCSGRTVLERAVSGEPVILPEKARALTAGLDWAGNSGKLIAHLLFKPHTFGESYTVSGAPQMTWGEVADLYTRVLGVRFEWMDTQEYLRRYAPEGAANWILTCDRFFERRIDNRKIMAATGLAAKDLRSIEEGLRIELTCAGAAHLIRG